MRRLFRALRNLCVLYLLGILIFSNVILAQPYHQPEEPYKIKALSFRSDKHVTYFKLQGLEYEIAIDRRSGYVIRPTELSLKLRFVSSLLDVVDFNSRDPATFTKLYLLKKAIGFPFDNYSEMEVDYYSWGSGTYSALIRYCDTVTSEATIVIPPWRDLSDDLKAEIRSAYRRAFSLSFNVPKYRPLMINLINSTNRETVKVKVEGNEVGQESREDISATSTSETKGSEPGLASGLIHKTGKKLNRSKREIFSEDMDKRIVIGILILLIIFTGVIVLLIRAKPGRPKVPVETSGMRFNEVGTVKPLSHITERGYQGTVPPTASGTGFSQPAVTSEEETDSELIRSLFRRIEEQQREIANLQKELEELRHALISKGESKPILRIRESIPRDNLKAKLEFKTDSPGHPVEELKGAGKFSDKVPEDFEPVLPKHVRDASSDELLEVMMFQLEKLESVLDNVLRLGMFSEDQRNEVMNKFRGLKEYVREHKKLNISRIDEIVRKDIMAIVETLDCFLASHEKPPVEVVSLRKELLNAANLSEIRIEVGKTRVNILEHRVVDIMSTDEYPEGVIVRVVEPGYRYKGRVVKRAKVIEARKHKSFW